jgi:H+/Cl- antiporter ClcA
MYQKINWIARKFVDFMEWLRQKTIHKEIGTATLQAIPLWIASLLTGLVAVAYEKLFSVFEHFGHLLTLQHPALSFIFIPCFFLLSWGLVRKFAPTARGSGIPQLMASIELASPGNDARVDKLLSLKIAFIKIISSLSLLLGHGAIGREGPTLQISASIFRFINRILPDFWPPVSKRIMLVTGGASGLAAAFNTPLGGIVFVVEELTKTHLTHFRTAVLPL